MLLRQVPAQPTPPGLASSRRWLTRPQKRAGDAASTAPPRLTRCSSSGGRADGGAGASRGGQQHDAAEPAGAAPQLRDLQLQMWEAKKRMERCAQAGEYAEAAAARDQLRALELRSRQLELQALADARATVLFSIGARLRLCTALQHCVPWSLHEGAGGTGRGATALCVHCLWMHACMPRCLPGMRWNTTAAGPRLCPGAQAR